MTNGNKECLKDLEISERLTFVNLNCKTAEEAIRVLGKSLEEHDKVYISFIEAVITREKDMPTGILTSAGGVAIPHTDTKHVIQSAIAVGLLESPVNFHNIASPSETLQVDLVFLLAISRVETVTKVLSALAELLQDKDSLEQLKAMIDPLQVARFLNKTLKIIPNYNQSSMSLEMEIRPMAKKKIWVACGSAVASSTMAAHTLEKMCEERDLDVEIDVVAYRDIGGKSNQPDLVIVLAPGIDATTYTNLKGVPFIMGLAFITGINKENVMNEVEEIIRNRKEM